MKRQASKSDVRVRFAPSPTGDLHIGGLRTALYNYLFAEANNGTMVLRIEDTDKTREVEGSTEKIVEWLKWAGISYYEGPGGLIEKENNYTYKLPDYTEATKQGKYAPYIQSQRLHIYQENVVKLLESKQAYHCFCSADRLKQMRKEQAGSKHQKTKYDRFCLSLSEQEVQDRVASGEPYVIRMLVPNGKTEHRDLIHGKIIFDHDSVDDQVIMKSDGFPTYHFANVVDDHLMKITHVIRGEEWLPSTPKHLILYRMLNVAPPYFAHLPLLLNANGQKLSKRQGDVSVQDYIDKEYLPEALINGLALLGWNPPQTRDNEDTTSEVLTLDQMKSLFRIDKVGKSGVKFDERKLVFFNTQHIRLKHEGDKPRDEWNRIFIRYLDGDEFKVWFKMSTHK